MAEMPAGYDAWKTRVPDSWDVEEEHEPEPCWHDEFDDRGFCKECGGSAVSIALAEERTLQAILATQRRMRWEHRLRHLYAFRRWLLRKTLDRRLKISAWLWRTPRRRAFMRRLDVDVVMNDEEIPF